MKTGTKIERFAAHLDRWRATPRFRAPASALFLASFLAAGFLVSLNRGAGAPSPLPAPAFVAPAVPPPAPPPALPPAPAPAPAPTAPVETGCPQGCTEPSPRCTIKGNISWRHGERIYHLPGQRFYDVTVITPKAGERWFCTEAEARANGWRKSKL